MKPNSTMTHTRCLPLLESNGNPFVGWRWWDDCIFGRAMETHLLDEGDEMIAFLGEKLRPICLSEGEGMRKERGETKFWDPSIIQLTSLWPTYSPHVSKVDRYGILMGEIANKLDFNTHCQWDLSPTYRLIMQMYFSYFHPIIKGTHSQSYTNVVQFNDQLSIIVVISHCWLKHQFRPNYLCN